MKFHVDLGVGDELLEPLEQLSGTDWLGFAGLSAVSVPALSAEQHWAEKLHAYTRPRDSANSRVRDLVDLVLLIERHDLDAVRVRQAVTATFTRRNTHDVPHDVPEPPSQWAKPFVELAGECGLDHTAVTAHERVTVYWESTRALPERTE